MAEQGQEVGCKKTYISERYDLQEVVQSHYCSRSWGTCHIEEKVEQLNFGNAKAVIRNELAAKRYFTVTNIISIQFRYLASLFYSAIFTFFFSFLKHIPVFAVLAESINWNRCWHYRLSVNLLFPAANFDQRPPKKYESSAKIMDSNNRRPSQIA